MSKDTKTTSMGLDGLVFITFLVLKLTKVIDWSWWWVTSPLWIPIAILSVILAIVLVMDISQK